MKDNLIEKIIQKFVNVYHDTPGGMSYEHHKRFLRNAVAKAQANERERVLEWAETHGFSECVFKDELRAFLNQTNPLQK